MPLPPLYKYLDVEGALKTLEGRCLRFAKPSEFQDQEDMTVNSLFSNDFSAALAEMSDGFVDAILGNLDARPTCSPKQRTTVLTLQKMLRAAPEMESAIKAGLRNNPKILENETKFWKAASVGMIQDINTLLQTYRVLCVSADRGSDRMWREYSQDHQGVILRIEPSVAKASKFLLFSPVTYHEKRPPVYPDTSEFPKEVLFGDRAARALKSMNSIIYGKTNDYRFESEYRLAIPLGEGEEDYRVLSYHPEEITELYLGSAMSEQGKRAMIDLARSVNRNIAILQTERDASGAITFA